MKTVRRVTLVVCALLLLGSCGFGENVEGQGPTERPDYLDKNKANAGEQQ